MGYLRNKNKPQEVGVRGEDASGPASVSQHELQPQVTVFRASLGSSEVARMGIRQSETLAERGRLKYYKIK